ncbi:OLC1v1021062C4 [Oldenlandia corymbosa var. corymbosa]|uniref:OLC1v1021062C4 n=1 Tax=Oldenlandia corymbosa var. corymbosa TaxID=529605 RepID=A0AAV1BVH2_OLDCO|nr:OLC1v1021062C4 [Oldenlandia corymbosa var. corymbosa]
MVGKERRSGGGGGGGGGASLSSSPSSSSWSLKKLIAYTCASFSRTSSTSRHNQTRVFLQDDALANADANPPSPPSIHDLNVCAICLDSLDYNSGGSGPTPAIFTAQCSHSFHFSCISSNVRHGSLTCPICRAYWTQLPRTLNSRYSLHTTHSDDPILQILDNSIATFRVHRRSFLLSARYDDDDPLVLTTRPSISHHHRLRISLLPLRPTIHLCQPPQKTLLPPPPHHLPSSGGGGHGHRRHSDTATAYLCVKLELQPPTDLVLVASPNGPHLRLLKQAMALVILSLRPEDRLAIVAYSSAAARLFPLKRMTSCGKRTAIQLIDRLFHTGFADPSVGLKKGFKVLNDRVYRNPESCILHLTDSPTWSYSHHNNNLGTVMGEVNVKIHRFHVGFGFGGSHGYVMHEFEKFLAGMLGGAIRDIQLKMKDGRIIRLRELRGGEERRFPLLLEKSAAGYYCVEYSYIESGGGTEDDCNCKTGEMLVGIGADQRERYHGGLERRTSSAETWEYHDSFMARRWAKHLHGNKLLLNLNHV